MLSIQTHGAVQWQFIYCYEGTCWKLHATNCVESAKSHHRIHTSIKENKKINTQQIWVQACCLFMQDMQFMRNVHLYIYIYTHTLHNSSLSGGPFFRESRKDNEGCERSDFKQLPQNLPLTGIHLRTMKLQKLASVLHRQYQQYRVRDLSPHSSRCHKFCYSITKLRMNFYSLHKGKTILQCDSCFESN